MSPSNNTSPRRSSLCRRGTAFLRITRDPGITPTCLAWLKESTWPSSRRNAYTSCSMAWCNAGTNPRRHVGSNTMNIVILSRDFQARQLLMKKEYPFLPSRWVPCGQYISRIRLSTTRRFSRVSLHGRGPPCCTSGKTPYLIHSKRCLWSLFQLVYMSCWPFPTSPLSSISQAHLMSCIRSHACVNQLNPSHSLRKGKPLWPQNGFFVVATDKQSFKVCIVRILGSFRCSTSLNQYTCTN